MYDSTRSPWNTTAKNTHTHTHTQAYTHTRTQSIIALLGVVLTPVFDVSTTSVNQCQQTCWVSSTRRCLRAEVSSPQPCFVIKSSSVSRMSFFIICWDAATAGTDEADVATTGLGAGVLTNLRDPARDTFLAGGAPLLNLSLSMLSDTTFSICQTSTPKMRQIYCCWCFLFYNFFFFFQHKLKKLQHLSDMYTNNEPNLLLLLLLLFLTFFNSNLTLKCFLISRFSYFFLPSQHQPDFQLCIHKQSHESNCFTWPVVPRVAGSSQVNLYLSSGK